MHEIDPVAWQGAGPGGVGRKEELCARLGQEGWKTAAPADAAAAVEALRNKEMDMVLLTVGESGLDVLEILRQARALARPVPVLLLPEEPGLGEQARLLQAILDSTGEGVLVADERGELVFHNGVLERLLGPAAAGTAAAAWLAARDFRRGDGVTPLPTEEQPLVRALRGEFVNEDHLRLCPADGPARWLVAAARPLLDGAGKVQGTVATFRDETEQRHLHERLAHAHKLSAMGRLAGGIAHDFNNLLTVINGYAELLGKRLGAGDAARELLAEIHGAGQRAAALTGQLLTLSRRQPAPAQLVDLNDVVQGAARMLGRLLGNAVELSTRLEQGVGLVYADHGQVELVLLNLAINARDAMPTGGRLVLATAAVPRAEAAAGLGPGCYARLTVSDTGAGMTAEVQAHLGEPFFTTKGAGKGTGLGLATVRDLVRQWGGAMEVQSAPGRGTTVALLLPCAAAPAAALAAGRPAAALPGRGTETILLLEPDAGVRALERRTLETAGYRVLEAAHGEEAAELAATHTRPIDLLIIDVVLPRPGGAALVERLRQQRPAMRVLIQTGQPVNATSGPGPAGSAWLLKPFTPSALARKVREVLDAGRQEVRR
jgi:two-component system cell cycle sensor histidine kinase/response regulator CckA